MPAPLLLQCTCLLVNQTHNMTQQMEWKMVRVQCTCTASWSNNTRNRMTYCVYSAEKFLEVYKKAQETPQKKYSFPQTEAQEVGWDTTPLIDQQRYDSRLHHPRSNSEITKYMDAAWRQKEQESLQQQ